MQIAQFQQWVDAWVQANGGYWPPLANFARLVEETGELGRHLNVQEGRKPLPPGAEGAGGETGDILFVLAALACQMGVDLEQAALHVMRKQRARGGGDAAPPR